MIQNWTIRYTGTPVLARFVAETFEEYGLEVSWDPPMEERGGTSDLHEVVVLIAAQGTVEAMKAAIVAARERFSRGEVAIEPPLDDEDDGGEGSAPAA